MTSDDEKDPPVPAHLEGISLKRVHDGQVLGEPDSDDTTSPPTQGQTS
ncbi:hypothetical protein [Arthrobacter sp. L77]|nr:hypothetical protein [Arthrobacter sp. L77]